MTDRRESRVSAVVLAAGRSARMGEAKQLLRVQGRALLDRVLENVRCSSVDEIVLVLGASADLVRRELAEAVLRGVRVVINGDYESGMASSLRAGLATVSCESDAALIVLGDQPFVRPETMDQIIACYRGSETHIVVPYHRGSRGNPVLLGRAVFPEAMALEGDVGCRAIFAKHADQLVQVEVDDPGILEDIDRREDFEELIRRRFPSRTVE